MFKKEIFGDKMNQTYTEYISKIPKQPYELDKKHKDVLEKYFRTWQTESLSERYTNFRDKTNITNIDEAERQIIRKILRERQG